MLVSIITISFNSRKLIDATMLSVMRQSYANLEYVVQDGGSTDGTANRIREIAATDPRIKFISAPDSGIYDALNRALARTSGDLIGFVHAGDFLCDGHVLSDIVRETQSAQAAGLIYGNKRYCDEFDPTRHVRYWKSKPIAEPQFRNGEMPPHQATYFRRSVCDQLGGFRLDMPIAADYEWLLRAIVKNGFEARYFDRDIITMRNNGVSNNSFLNIIRSNQQAYRAWRINGLRPPFLFSLRKVIRKIPQLLRRPGGDAVLNGGRVQ